MMLHQHFPIHAHHTSHYVPVSSLTNPVTNHNTSPPITLSAHDVLNSQMIDHSWIQFRSNLLGPASHLPEITRTQEIDVHWRWRRIRIIRALTTACSFKVLSNIFGLDFNVLCLQNLAEI